ncbi:RHS repeat-associated core domain-containing protein [Aliikangiella coralliicola]|uniref:Fibronectin type-III domain-containing protein n=1 Tax=Aliikangiella coralliicola TaxID=2592383 RepID=A0A545U7T9_9GAMM|nr:RHS repeat-associated core domain-containing protein [Aliikangiella coralliicola]TQV85534.1 hypothetical protein FLL46_20465 [Aliikangiella coralliicola]
MKAKKLVAAWLGICILAIWTYTISAAEVETQRVDECRTMSSSSGASLSRQAQQDNNKAASLPIGGDCDGGGSKPPVTPSSISVPSSNANGSYSVSWSRSSTATRYELYEQKNSGAWKSVYKGPGVSKRMSGKTDGKYRYRVRACNLKGCSGYRYTLTMTVSIPKPGTPSSISRPSSSSTGSYTVSWGAASGSVTRYELYERKNSGSWVSVYRGGARSKALSGRGNGSYTYRVRACNSSGCGGYRTSASTSVLHRPGTPSSIAVPTKSNGSTFTISWGASSGTVSRYELYEMQDVVDGPPPCIPATATSGTVQDRLTGKSLESNKTARLDKDKVSEDKIIAPSKVCEQNGKITTRAPGSWSRIYSGTARSKGISGKSNGVFSYRVRACNNSGCSSYRTGSNKTKVTIPVPGFPASITAPTSTSTSGSYTVSWGIASGKVGYYELFEQKNGGAWNRIYSGPSRSKSLVGRNDAAYRYQVKACNETGCGGSRYSSSFSVLKKPTMPASISVPSTNTSGSYSVHWGFALGTVARYELQQKKNSGTWTAAYSGTSTSRAYSGVSDGSYLYRVRACNSSGCSGYRASGGLSVLQLPGNPSSINVASTNVTGSYPVSWGGASGTVARYELYEYDNREPDDICPPQQNSLTRVDAKAQQIETALPIDDCEFSQPNPSTARTWVKIYSGLSLNKVLSGKSSGQFKYRVRACNGTGCSSFKNSGFITIDRIGLISGFSVPANNVDGKYTVSWGNAYNSKRYELYEKVGSGNWGRVFSGVSRSKAYSGKTDGSYSYKVRACNDSGCGNYVGPKTVEVLFPPGKPTSISVPADNSGNYTVSWGAASGSVAKYELYEQSDGSGWSRKYSGIERSKTFNKNSTAEYSYKVRACNNSGCSDYRRATTYTAIMRSSPEAPPVPHVEPVPAIDSLSESVGSTFGEFRVDESGAASYSIPVSVPAGTAGVAPTLTLNYNSHGGNGVMGHGWYLGGLSAISRCRQTYEQDRTSKPVNLTSSDRFCLDGQRLMLHSGNYGANGAEYKTEIDSFAKIVSYGNVEGGPAYFKVWRKDGSVSEYGRTDDALVEAKGTVYSDRNKVAVWAINRMSDSVGNYIDFEYEENDSTGENHIKRINYTGKIGASAHAPYNSVEFVYDNSRSDKPTTYFAGAKTQSTRRLIRIDSYDKNRAYRSYFLNYSITASSRRSILTSVQECSDNSKSSCFQPTTFSWQSALSGLNARQISSVPDYLHAIPTDVDGNGLQDLIYFTQDGTRSSDLHILFSDGKRLTQPATDKFWVSSSGMNLEQFNEAVAVSNATARAADIDGNGLADIVYMDRKYWYARTSNRKSLSDRKLLFATNYTTASSKIRAAKYAYFMDFNGDGFTDALYPNSGQTRLRLSSWVTGEGQKLGSEKTLSFNLKSHSADNVSISRTFLPQPGDFNGDGYIDVLAKVTKNWSDTGGGCPNGNQSSNNADQETPSSLTETRYIEPCDGGGSTSYSTITWTLFTSNGDSTLKEFSAISGGDKIELDNIQVADINADGLSDVIYKHNNTWYYRLSTGKGIGSQKTIGAISNEEHMRLMDYNGDGFIDIAYPGSSTWMVKLWGYAGGYNSTATNTYASVGNLSEDINQFIDINGDGMLDHLLIDKSANQHIVKLSKNASRATDKITKITNGLGAETEINYLSLTDPDVYTKETNGWAVCWWRCSPIVEYVAPLQVVSAIGSSAPRANESTPGLVNRNAKSHVTYRYRGAKLQGGGRGLLGFHQVSSLDVQTKVLTSTTYRQDFPFIGSPLETKVTWLGNSYNHTSSSGLLLPPVDCGYDCTFQPPCVGTSTACSQPEIPAGAVKLSSAKNTWTGFAGHNGGFSQPSQKILRPRLLKTEEISYALSGEKIKSVTTQYNFDSLGNNTVLSVETRDANGQLAARKDVQNTYLNDTSSWHLGRLSFSRVTHSKPGHNDVILESSYSYDADSGLLKEEVVEPNGNVRELLRTVYQYDDFGNRIKTTKCSQQVTGCGTNTQQEIGNPLFVNRYGVEKYNSDGRHVDEVYNSDNARTSKIYSRGQFGPTKVEDSSSVISELSYDNMGQPYFTRSSLGEFSHTTSRLCSQVACPSHASYREKIRRGGKPEQWSYYDVIGREVRSAIEGFDGRQVFVDTEYDLLGRVKRKSEPYYSGDVIYWTHFNYDILGRLISTKLPDNSSSSVQYAGLVVTSTNQLSQQKIERINVLGEVTEVTDSRNHSMQFSYDVLGNAILISDAKNNLTRVAYDRLGRKISTQDSDKGLWRYQYNAAGEIVVQQDAKNQKIENYFDSEARLIRRIDRDSDGMISAESTWTFDRLTHGLLLSEKTLTSDYEKQYAYDDFGRLFQQSHIIGGINYAEKITYDQFNRQFQYFDVVGDNVAYRNIYNEFGYLSEQREELSGVRYFKIITMNARGQITEHRSGNGVSSFRSYDLRTGVTKNIVSEDGIQNMSFQFDSLGNLLKREDHGGSKSLSESFTYDELNRVTRASVAGGVVQTFNYDSIGNLTYKSDVGNYTYGQNGAGVHAVTQTNGVGGTKNYLYDANGNMVSGNGRQLTYGVSDKLIKVTKGEHSSEFSYGPRRNRFERRDTQSGATIKRHYVGSTEVIYHDNGNVEYKRYIGTNTFRRYLYDNENKLLEDITYYLFKDHLGSVSLVTDQYKSVVDEFSYDAFGARRNVSDWKKLTSQQLASLTVDSLVTSRGYTSHEHLDEVGLVHMNGRIYDAKLGRFIQADPFVQSPDNMQNLNRYSYVLNNPLSFTDPSGYFFKAIGQFFKRSWRTILSTAVTIVGVILSPYTGGASVILAGMLSGYIATGTMQGAVIGAFSSAVFMGVGVAFQEMSGFAAYVGKTAAHGVAGGAMSYLQGGKFGHGFISAGLTQFASGAIDSIKGIGIAARTARVSAAAAVGGTASQLTGGKFSNGATTAAFSRAFNDELHSRGKNPDRKKRRAIRRAKRDARELAKAFQTTPQRDQMVENWVTNGRPSGRNGLHVKGTEFGNSGTDSTGITNPDQVLVGEQAPGVYGGTLKLVANVDVAVHSHGLEMNTGFSPADVANFQGLMDQGVSPYVYTAENSTLYSLGRVIVHRRPFLFIGRVRPVAVTRSRVVRRWP